MNNVIKTDFHTFNTSLPFKPLKYFYNCETAASNGFASISAAGSGGASAPKPVFLKFPFPPLFFRLPLKAAQSLQSGLEPAATDTRFGGRERRVQDCDARQ